MGWIARRITDIDKVFSPLEINQAEQATILKSNPYNAKMDTMLLWKKKKGDQATLKTLVASLLNDNLSVALANDIIKHFKGNLCFVNL